MLVEAIREILVRDLNRAADEIGLYATDEALWQEMPGIANTGGTLALHLAGNINHFFGAVLGGSGYVRTRDLEFSRREGTREDLASALREAAVVASEALSGVSDADLDADYPEEFAGKTMKTGWMIIQMLTHLNYHFGQINYHRRIVDGG